MLSDRSYMREEYQRERTSALTWLISAIVAGFALQLLMASPLVRGGAQFTELLGLSVDGLKAGRAWTLLTHVFLHSTDYIVQVIFNVLALYFLGRELLPMLGSRRFLSLLAAATIVGGTAWAATHWQGPGAMHLGAGAAIDALFIVFACFFPNQQLNFLLFFLFPVTLKPKHLAFALVGAVSVVFFCYEISGNALPLNLDIASSAHLGGIFTGYIYYRFVHDGRWFTAQDSVEIELPRWMRRVRKPTSAVAGVPGNVVVPRTPDAIRAEVDRVLDKINSEGFGALTPEEKQLLDEAKDLLSRRA
ncbi:MAG: rhomboid family intramembrane serine protease [Opitutus sp.]|nr:rhomboid family intramembrane serine protease [Opitutus sp.]